MLRNKPQKELYIKAWNAQTEALNSRYKWYVAYAVLATILPPLNAIYAIYLGITSKRFQEATLWKKILFTTLGSIVPFLSTLLALIFNGFHNAERQLIVAKEYAKSDYIKTRQYLKNTKATSAIINGINKNADKTKKPKKVVIVNGDNVTVYRDNEQYQRYLKLNQTVRTNKTDVFKNQPVAEWYQQSYQRSAEIVAEVQRKFGNN